MTPAVDVPGGGSRRNATSPTPASPTSPGSVQQRTGAPIWRTTVAVAVVGRRPAAFWGRCGSTSDSATLPSGARQPGDAGCTVVPRCTPELCRPHRPQCAHRPASHSARQRRRTGHRAGVARIAQAHRRIRADAAFARGDVRVTRVRRVPAQHPRGGHRVPRDRQRRRRLERLRTGLFRQGGAGPARAARAGRPYYRRRLSVRGQDPRQARPHVAALQTRLPTLRATVLASELTANADINELETVPVDFDHALWILFSSGTHRAAKGNHATATAALCSNT